MAVAARVAASQHQHEQRRRLDAGSRPGRDQRRNGHLRPPVVAGTTKTTTASELTKALKLAKLRKELATLKTTAHKLDPDAGVDPQAHHPPQAPAKQIASVKAREAKLLVEIDLLVK